MATLTQNEPRAFVQGDVENYPVVADDIVYQGAALGEDTNGHSRPLQAGDVFQGFALEKADNTGGAAADVRVRTQVQGRIELDVAGASAITVNDLPAVYASDDNTFTLTSTSNSLIGYVSQWVSGTTCIVTFSAALARAALQS